MSGAILVLNAGSSSLKFSVYDGAGAALSLLARGQVDGLGTAPRFTARDAAGQLLAESPCGAAGGGDHAAAFAHLAQWLRAQYSGQVALGAVGHRVVHGGVEFLAPVRIDPDVLRRLEALSALAPLHQPHNVAGIRAVAQQRPDVPQVACFDTAFHRGRPAVAERFGLPDELHQRGVRRWGFHGLSYESIALRFRRLAPDAARGRVIVAHLGNGASLCALRGGRSVDTTMGFSTLDGLPMGTRCGGLDPGVVLHLLRQWSPAELEAVLYRESGLLGISGISGDMRELLASPSPRAAEACEYFVYRTVREIGALTAVLGGLDALVFTAGIGENSPVIRQRICAGLAWLGVALDPAANEGGPGCLSPAGQTPAVWALRTDEEGMIAAHTRALVTGRSAPAAAAI